MKRKLLLALAIFALPALSYALGLGKLQLNSSLNQPFDARIELLSASASELDSLNVGLADAEAFRRARIDRPYILSKLRFEVVETENGVDYIKVSSREAIREPFLNFLLETAWSNGRLYREYTVLLDPPLYDPKAGSRSLSESYEATPSSESYVSDDSSDDMTTPQSSIASYSGNEYGPTDSSDTLWAIASRVRPDSSVSVQQMMMALLRANPDAFINGNINGLKRGQILTIPDSDETTSLSAGEAISEVGAQNSNWQGGAGLDSVSERADSMSVADTDTDYMTDESAADVIEDDESELRLVAASSDGAAEGGATGGGDGGADLALANEELQAARQENEELKDRNQEAETIIQDLKRLIELKDDELATLQQQMAGADVAEATGDLVEEETMPVEEAMDSAEEDVDAFEEEIEEEVVGTGDGIEDDMQEADMELEADTELAIEDELFEEAEAAEEELVDDEELVEEEELVSEAEVEQAAPVADTPPAPAGMVDKILGFIMGNLILIAGALGAVIIVIVLLLVVSRRKQQAAEEPAVATTEFPDFEEEAPETEAPADEASADMETTADAAASAEALQPDAESEAEPEAEAVAAESAEEEAPAAEPAPEAAAEEPEEEPLAEVNVLIAYEQFDQAEEFVRDAIAGSPDNVDFHSKLLEVFYAANDRKKYEEAAQVLHDKVNGEGPHWEMAQAMWQEMSPSRALFEEGADDEPAPAPAAEGGGIMDITADDEEAAADASVDFDLGMDTGAAAPEAAAEPEDEILDLTADGDDISVLDVTTAATVDESTSDEDLLDVTAAVGLEPQLEESTTGSDDEPMLDVTGGGGEALLDITGSAEQEAAEDDDVLDISHGGGEDLLDVTANANLEAEGLEEDLMDVTSSVGAEEDGEELLEVTPEEETAAADDNSLDFDIGGMTEEPADQGSDEVAELQAETAEEDDADDNLIDFDTGTAEEEIALEIPEEGDSAEEEGGGIDLSLDDDTAADDVGLELDMDATAGAADEDAGVELDLSVDDEIVGDDSESTAELDLSIGDDSRDTAEISIDNVDDDQTDDLAIDLSIDDDTDDSSDEAPAVELDTDSGPGDDLEIDLTIDGDAGQSDSGADDSGSEDEIELDMDFDLEIEDTNSGEPDIDMDGTVEMPKLDIADTGIEIDDDDDDDDDDDHTVFVPRSGAADEQSAEDEIATKLDLAKAYVELGDKDSAKGILDEVMADGNDEQKQTAQDLLNQLG